MHAEASTLSVPVPTSVPPSTLAPQWILTNTLRVVKGSTTSVPTPAPRGPLTEVPRAKPMLSAHLRVVPLTAHATIPSASRAPQDPGPTPSARPPLHLPRAANHPITTSPVVPRAPSAPTIAPPVTGPRVSTPTAKSPSLRSRSRKPLWQGPAGKRQGRPRVVNRPPRFARP
jgi:hypothetical protein